MREWGGAPLAFQIFKIRGHAHFPIINGSRLHYRDMEPKYVGTLSYSFGYSGGPVFNMPLNPFIMVFITIGLVTPSD